MFRIDDLKAVRHSGERSMQQVYIDALTLHGDVLRSYGVTTPAHAAMLLGQVAHETGGFTILHENMNYTAERIRQVWPSRPGAVQFAGNPRGLANSVYGSRMGNRSGTDDGFNFRGTGLAQHTGRDGFEAVSRISGHDFARRPELLTTDPLMAAHGLGAFWKWKKLDQVCPDTSEASIIAVTRRWNGGRIGLADRIVRVRKAARALGGKLPPINTKPPVAAVQRETGALVGVTVGGGATVSAVDNDHVAGIILLCVLAIVAVGGVMIYRMMKIREALREAALTEVGGDHV